MKWNKISKSTNSEGTTITYKCDALPGITHIPDANREGTGNPSPYVTVVIKGYQGVAERMAEDEDKRSN